jgi:hypothetical protein
MIPACNPLKHNPNDNGLPGVIENRSILMIGFCIDVREVQEILDSTTRNINNNIMVHSQTVYFIDVVMNNEQSRARREAARQYYRELYDSKSWANTGFKYFIFLGFLGMLFFSDMFQLLWMDDDIELLEWESLDALDVTTLEQECDSPKESM